MIGFRLVNAIIPYTVYTVNDNNKNIKISLTANSQPIEINLDSGIILLVD